MATITTEEIALFSKYILEISGIKLDQSKGYLIENRLTPLARDQRCKTLKDLLLKAKADSSEQLKRDIVDAISTNETFFFRDSVPFDLMRNKIVPDIIDRRRRNATGAIPFRVWSAACSTGQEVYSIAITLLEMLPNRNKYDISILGTDISGKAIAQASYGKYNQFEVERGLDPQIRGKYFARLGTDWRIKDEIRTLAKFEKINLMRPFSNLGAFDLVFCRNVAIYFSQPDKIKLFQKIAKVLKSDGALIVGGSESLSGIAPEFTSKQYLRSIYYQLQGYDSQREPSPQIVTQKKPLVQAQRKPARSRTPRTDKVILKKTTLKKNEGKKCKPTGHMQTGATATPAKQEIKKDLKTQDTQGQESAPVSLSEKIAGSKKSGTKKSFLGALQNKYQTTSSSLISAKQSERSPMKESLLEKIARKNKKK